MPTGLRPLQLINALLGLLTHFLFRCCWFPQKSKSLFSFFSFAILMLKNIMIYFFFIFLHARML